jgi:hypothetical protein
MADDTEFSVSPRVEDKDYDAEQRFGRLITLSAVGGFLALLTLGGILWMVGAFSGDQPAVDDVQPTVDSVQPAVGDGNTVPVADTDDPGADLTPLHGGFASKAHTFIRTNWKTVLPVVFISLALVATLIIHSVIAEQRRQEELAAIAAAEEAARLQHELESQFLPIGSATFWQKVKYAYYINMWLCVGVFVVFLLSGIRVNIIIVAIIIAAMITLHGFLIIPLLIYLLAKKLKLLFGKVNPVLSFFMLSVHTVSMALGTPLFLVVDVLVSQNNVGDIWTSILRAWHSMDLGEIVT